MTDNINKNSRSTALLIATVISVVAVLAICFYVANLNAENKRLTQINRNLLAAVEKEKQENAWLSEEMRALAQRLQGERIAGFSANLPAETYRKLYPDLKVAPAGKFQKTDPKVIYLTFDDGPFAETDLYLDLLKKLDVKATFFVVGRGDDVSIARIKRMSDDGHTVAPHSYTHGYKKIYASVTEFLHDFKHTNDLIVQATGQKPDIFRFPGGSVNAYNKETQRQIIDEMHRRGYTYYDWSISAADIAGNGAAETAEDNIISKIRSTPHKIVLMHEDGNDDLEFMEKVIVKLKEQGYRFEKLTNKVEPVRLETAENT